MSIYQRIAGNLQCGGWKVLRPQNNVSRLYVISQGLLTTLLQQFRECGEVLYELAEFAVDLEKGLKGLEGRSGLAGVCGIESGGEAGFGASFRPLLSLFVKAAFDGVLLIKDNQQGGHARLVVVRAEEFAHVACGWKLGQSVNLEEPADPAADHAVLLVLSQQ